jgi:DnaJ-class molecular chaperone
MIRDKMRQICLKCKGTGIDKTRQLTDKSGKAILAPVYEKGEGNRYQYVDCRDCQGTGYTMQPSPKTLMQRGKKKDLTDEEYDVRYDVAFN